MPSMFRRPLTPKTMQHLKNNYFIKTSADKFKYVREDGRCLRCFSKLHHASECPTYTRPTPSPCKFCWHLFHSSDACIFYNTDGKSRPPSKVRSAWLDTPHTSVANIVDIEYFIEDWFQHNDFCYISQKQHPVGNNTRLVTTLGW